MRKAGRALKIEIRHAGFAGLLAADIPHLTGKAIHRIAENLFQKIGTEYWPDKRGNVLRHNTHKTQIISGLCDAVKSCKRLTPLRDRVPLNRARKQVDLPPETTEHTIRDSVPESEGKDPTYIRLADESPVPRTNAPRFSHGLISKDFQPVPRGVDGSVSPFPTGQYQTAYLWLRSC